MARLGLRAGVTGGGGCSGVRALGCVLVGLSGIGLVFIPILTGAEAVRVAAFSLFLASLAAPLYLVGQRLGVAWLALSALGIALALAAPHLWPLIVAIGFLGAALLALESLPAGIVGLGVTASLALVAGPGDYKWLVLAAYSALPAAAAALATRRVHPLVSAAFAVLVLLFSGKPEAVAAAIAPVLFFLAATGAMEKSMCPFRSDSRLVMVGSLLAVAGLAASMGEPEPPVAARGLWAAGLLLLVTGLLVPSTAFQAARALASQQEPLQGASHR